MGRAGGGVRLGEDAAVVDVQGLREDAGALAPGGAGQPVHGEQRSRRRVPPQPLAQHPVGGPAGRLAGVAGDRDRGQRPARLPLAHQHHAARRVGDQHGGGGERLGPGGQPVGGRRGTGARLLERDRPPGGGKAHRGPGLGQTPLQVRDRPRGHRPQPVPEPVADLGGKHGQGLLGGQPVDGQDLPVREADPRDLLLRQRPHREHVHVQGPAVGARRGAVHGDQPAHRHPGQPELLRQLPGRPPARGLLRVDHAAGQAEGGAPAVVVGVLGHQHPAARVGDQRGRRHHRGREQRVVVLQVHRHGPALAQLRGVRAQRRPQGRRGPAAQRLRQPAQRLPFGDVLRRAQLLLLQHQFLDRRRAARVHGVDTGDVGAAVDLLGHAVDHQQPPDPRAPDAELLLQLALERGHRLLVVDHAARQVPALLVGGVDDQHPAGGVTDQRVRRHDRRGVDREVFGKTGRIGRGLGHRHRESSTGRRIAPPCLERVCAHREQRAR